MFCTIFCRFVNLSTPPLNENIFFYPAPRRMVTGIRCRSERWFRIIVCRRAFFRRWILLEAVIWVKLAVKFFLEFRFLTKIDFFRYDLSGKYKFCRFLRVISIWKNGSHRIWIKLIKNYKYFQSAFEFFQKISLLDIVLRAKFLKKIWSNFK